MSAKINKLFSQVNNIPQISEVIRVLINQLNDPDIDLNEITQNVEKEQVIAVKVLRLVNSASFGLPKKVASIKEAVILLGMGRLKTLVIASGIVSSASKIDNFDINQFWLNSFSTASYAKWLASESGCNVDIAFTAGLLSGLGTVLIHLGQEKAALDIEQRIKEGHSRPSLEKMRLGYTSQEVSAELCKLWKFSDQLIIPVAQCTEPLLAEPVSKISCTVFIARLIASAKVAQLTEDEILPLISAEIIEQLRLPEGFFKENLAELLVLESGLEGLLD
jgi:HD-like signal output (HDOD) protein